MRAILNRCFGAKSHSVYDSIESDNMQSVVGHEPLGMPRDDFLAQARATSEVYYIKTHEYPPDEQEKAIYVVRDARAALASHRNYCRDIDMRTIPLECLILGVHPAIHWSNHVEAWLARPSVLLLHFEELSAPSRETLERISAFVGLSILQNFDLTFGDLHALNSEFFRAGRNDEGIVEVELECPALFWRTHGRVMQRLGYVDAVPELTFAGLRCVSEYLRAFCRLETSRKPALPYPPRLRASYRKHAWRVLAETFGSHSR